MRQERRLRPRELGLMLVLAVAVTVAVVVRIDGRAEPAAGSPYRSLTGITAAGDRITLKLDRRHRMAGVVTRLRSACLGGHGWSIRWSPYEGNPIHFRRRGRYVTAIERKTDMRAGVRQQIAAGIEARLGRGRGSGTVRLVARFYRGSRQSQACESGWVPWAVGPHAQQRMAFVSPPRFLAAYYPSVPSLARHVSPARRLFIKRVDATCTREYRRIQRAEHKAARRRGAPTRVWDTYTRAHLQQFDAIRRLGSPPEAKRLYTRWLTNMADRVAREERITALLRRGDVRPARSIWKRVGALKMKGNNAGQRFGLTVCTSNGPDRTPVPR